MIKALRKIGGVFDSPTFDRDRANLFSGFTIGLTGLILNGAVLLFVMPLLLDPDDSTFRAITETVGFGQTLALILLGGATILATFLIPLRLISVFWGPRIGRYFDQIVLSGISPVRFIIGKAMSQNLFLGLIFFLLLPYLVLSMTLGGIDPLFFLAGLLLVWLYCMMLSLVTLWLSIHMNELIAAVKVILVAAIACFAGATPIPFQPVWLTPFPALLQPVYASMGEENFGPLTFMLPGFKTLFFGCAAGMSLIIAVALLGIALGPLYGIIRDNSTFGEVVRPGDSKRKRWFRIRHHIQRPSELAFFYENRSGFLKYNDGIIRWSLGYLGLSAVQAIVLGCFVGLIAFISAIGGPGGFGPGFAWFAHTFNLAVHGVAMYLAIFLFSHGRNTMYLRTPFVLGRRVTVAKADNWCFFLFISVSTAVAIGLPTFIQNAFMRGESIYATYDSYYSRQWGESGPRYILEHIHIYGALMMTASAIVIYLLARYLGQATWVKVVASKAAAAAYLLFFCFAPFIPYMLKREMLELRDVQWLQDWAPSIAMSSPFGVFRYMLHDFSSEFPRPSSSLPFWILHGTLVLVLIALIRIRGRRLRSSYLAEPELGSGSPEPPTKSDPPTKTTVGESVMTDDLVEAK